MLKASTWQPVHFSFPAAC